MTHRFSVDISDEFAEEIRKLTPPGQNYADVFRNGIAVLKILRENPGKHIGLVDDPEKLDIELINVLPQ